jgi:hypothetical protein
MRNEIINTVLDANKKMKHLALKKSWYEKNNILNIYDNIFQETSFLPQDCSLRERIFYIENNLYLPALCCFCNNKVQLKTKTTPMFLKTCSEDDCKSKLKSGVMKTTWAVREIEEKTDIFKKIGKSNKGRKQSKTEILNKQLRMLGKKQSQKTVSKRMNSRKLNNENWHSDETKLKLSVSNKLTHSSLEFREKTKEIYDKARIKQSKTMKEKIIKGEFTPPITNSWTKWTAFANKDNKEKKFRSSWEAVFWLLNENVEYEKLRINYCLDNEEKIYIVDFISLDKKEVYEIKPSSIKNNERNLTKQKALETWCLENNYKYCLIEDEWFVNHVPNYDFINNEHLKKPMRKFLCINQ